MIKRISLVLVMVLGSFVVYCTQQASSGSDRAFVKAANATACCGAAPVFTKITEGDVATAKGPTPPIDVHAFSELVLYITSGYSAPSCSIGAKFSVDGTTPFGMTGQAVPSGPAGGRIRVDGTQMQLEVLGSCGAFHYVVAGVGN